MKSELYTAAQGLVARQLQLDVIANNIANVDTTGFRGNSPFFRAYNHALIEGPANPMNAAANNQPVAAGIFTHSTQAAIKETGNPLDMALVGDGYFKVATPNGNRYTRNGQFTLKPDGTLVTNRGYSVLNTNNQPITLKLDAENTYVNRDGIIIQDGEQRGQINVATFADKTGLVAEEDTLLSMMDPQAAEIKGTAVVRSNYLEGSNINIAREMVNMIEAQRAYEINTRTIKTVDTGMNQQVIQGFAAR